eukprot:5344537-Karenia_brevis.AAC.1
MSIDYQHRSSRLDRTSELIQMPGLKHIKRFQNFHTVGLETLITKGKYTNIDQVKNEKILKAYVPIACKVDWGRHLHYLQGGPAVHPLFEIPMRGCVCEFYICRYKKHATYEDIVD